MTLSLRRPFAVAAGAAVLACCSAAPAQSDRGDLFGTMRGFGNRLPPSQSGSGRNVTVRPGFGYGGFGYGGFGGGFGYGPRYGGFGYYPGGYGGVFPTGFGLNGLNTGYVPYGPIVAAAPGAVGVGYGPLLPGGYGYGGGYGGYGGGYGGYGYGGGSVAVGVGAAGAAGLNPTGAVVGGNFGPNPAIADALREDADRWRGPVNLGDADPLPAAERPATERELAESLQAERRGDEAFASLEYHAAARAYREAAEQAPTRGEPLYRLAFARIATGDYPEAGDALRRAVALNPSLPTTGPGLAELWGDGNALARTEAVGRLAEYARADVRDPDRLFLLAAVMHAGGDSRAREIFEAAWRLTGGRPYLRAYLDPVAVRDLERAADEGGADDAPAAPPLPADADA